MNDETEDYTIETVEYSIEDFENLINRVNKQVKNQELKQQIINAITLLIMTSQQIVSNSDRFDSDNTEVNSKLVQTLDKIKRGTSCQWTKDVINSM